MYRPARPRNAAFTLVEMVIVLVVLGVIAALAIPTFQSLVDDSRERAVVLSAEALAGYGDAWAASEQIAPVSLDATFHNAACVDMPGCGDIPGGVLLQTSSGQTLFTRYFGGSPVCATITWAQAVGGQSTVAVSACAAPPASALTLSGATTAGPTVYLAVNDNADVLGIPEGSCADFGGRWCIVATDATTSGGTYSVGVQESYLDASLTYLLYSDTDGSFALDAGEPGGSLADLVSSQMGIDLATLFASPGSATIDLVATVAATSLSCSADGTDITTAWTPGTYTFADGWEITIDGFTSSAVGPWPYGGALDGQNYCGVSFSNTGNSDAEGGVVNWIIELEDGGTVHAASTILTGSGTAGETYNIFPSSFSGSGSMNLRLVPGEWDGSAWVAIAGQTPQQIATLTFAPTPSSDPWVNATISGTITGTDGACAATAVGLYTGGFVAVGSATTDGSGNYTITFTEEMGSANTYFIVQTTWYSADTSGGPGLLIGENYNPVNVTSGATLDVDLTHSSRTCP